METNNQSNSLQGTSDLCVAKSNDGLSVWGLLDLERRNSLLLEIRSVPARILYLWSLTLSHLCDSILFSQRSEGAQD